MTQVFADGDQVADPGLVARTVHIPVQSTGSRPSAPAPNPTQNLSLTRSAPHGPAMTPGKGVRRIRCVGCAHDTLPRTDDGAPLCQRCSELLAAADAEPGPTGPPTGPIFRTPRWFRRRPTLD